MFFQIMAWQDFLKCNSFVNEILSQDKISIENIFYNN